MASDHHTFETRSLTSTDLRNLADRLFSRSISQLTDLPPMQRADMVLASRIIRLLSVMTDDRAMVVDSPRWQYFYLQQERH